MNRNRTKDRQSSAVLGSQARELTEAELDVLTGGASSNYGIQALINVTAQKVSQANQAD
jgi:hypothetical protein